MGMSRRREKRMEMMMKRVTKARRTRLQMYFATVSLPSAKDEK